MSTSYDLLIGTPDLDDTARLEQIRQRAAQIESTPGLLAGDASEYVALKAEADEIVARIEAAAVADGRAVLLRRLTRRELRRIRDRFPPRTTDDPGVTEADVVADVRVGMNAEDGAPIVVWTALASHTFAADPDDPVLPGQEFWDWWWDTLTEGESNILELLAWQKATTVTAAPKSLPGLPTRKSAKNSA